MEGSDLSLLSRADKDGTLKGWKKFPHFLAGYFVLIDAVSWYLWVLVKGEGRKILAFLLGVDNDYH